MITIPEEQLAKLATIDTYGHKGQFRCGEFACWTEGHILIALKTDYDPNPGQVHYPKVPTLIATDAPRKASFQTDAAKLLSWCAIPFCPRCKETRIITCETCHGDGTVECKCECGECCHLIDCTDCDGTKKTPCVCIDKCKQGQVAGYGYNQHLIRRALEASEVSGPITVSIREKDNILDIRFPDGVICVMPLRNFYSSCEEFVP